MLRSPRFLLAFIVAVLPLSLAAQNRPGGGAPAMGPSAPALQAEALIVEGSILELQEAMATGTVSSADLVEAYLARVAAYDHGGPVLNAMLRLNPRAREEAEALDREREEGRVRGPLHGIPILVKDNFNTHDMPTTASLLALGALTPPEDATQIRLLREAGAIILGKTNLHELAAGITSISSLGGQTRNPYDPIRSPGGSSGGTAAGVAASFAAVGWGSDTCGSIRIPASENNLLGLRPTTGLSSSAGILPLSHTQDTGGPLARTAMDLALSLDATVGPDPADPHTRALEGRALPAFRDALDPDALQGARIGAMEAWVSGSQAQVTRVVREALAAMEASGAEVVPVELPGLEELLAESSVIDYELKFDLADYLAATPGSPVLSLGEILERGLHHEALDERLQHRNQVVDERESPEYRARLERQARLREALIQLMDEEGLDALAYPSMRGEPAILGAPLPESGCALSSHSGLPALSFPAGFSMGGLPVGLELLGRPFDDARLLAMAYALEQARPMRRAPLRTPPLADGRPPAPMIFGATVLGGGPGLTSAASAGFHATFTLDITKGELAYRVAVSGLPGDDVLAIVLQRRSGKRPMAVVERLAGPGRGWAEGTLSLRAGILEDLMEGHLGLGLHTVEEPLGAAWAPLRPVEPPR